MAWQLGNAPAGTDWQMGAAAYGSDVDTPTLLAGPTRDAVTPTTVNILGVASKTCTVRRIVDTIGSSEPNEAAFAATGGGQAVTAFTPFTVAITGQTQRTLRRVWLELKDAGGLRSVYSIPVLFPPTGFSYVELSALATSGDRLTATPDLAPGNAVAWGDVSGAGSVEVYPSAAFRATSTVVEFTATGGNFVDGWGADSTQTMTVVLALDFISEEINAPNQSATLLPNFSGIAFIIRPTRTSATVLASGTCELISGRLVGSVSGSVADPGDVVRLDAFWTQTVAGQSLRMNAGGDVTLTESA